MYVPYFAARYNALQVNIGSANATGYPDIVNLTMPEKLPRPSRRVILRKDNRNCCTEILAWLSSGQRFFTERGELPT